MSKATFGRYFGSVAVATALVTTTSLVSPKTPLVGSLSSVSYAQDANSSGDGSPSQETSGEDLTNREIPQGFIGNGNGHDARGDYTLKSRVHASTSMDGSCIWHVHVDVTYRDGSTDWYEYSTKVPCDQPAPYVTGAEPPPIQYVETQPQPQPLEPPPLPPPPPPPPPVNHSPCNSKSWPEGVDWIRVEDGGDTTYHYKDGTLVRCRDTKIVMYIPPAVTAAPKTEDKRHEKPRSETLKTSEDKTLDEKSHSAKDKTNSKSSENAEHSMRKATPDVRETSRHIAHATEAPRIGEMHAGGMRTESTHMSGHSEMAGMHMSGMRMGGFGGLGGMHLSGLGGF